MARTRIRKGDTVQVISGAAAGRTGKVMAVYPDTQRLLVEGINRVYKHLKPNRRNAQGGRLSKEMPISASNVLLYCSTCRRGVRSGKRYDEKETAMPVSRPVLMAGSISILVAVPLVTAVAQTTQSPPASPSSPPAAMNSSRSRATG